MTELDYCTFEIYEDEKKDNSIIETLLPHKDDMEAIKSVIKQYWAPIDTTKALAFNNSEINNAHIIVNELFRYLRSLI